VAHGRGTVHQKKLTGCSHLNQQTKNAEQVPLSILSLLPVCWRLKKETSGNGLSFCAVVEMERSLAALGEERWSRIASDDGGRTETTEQTWKLQPHMGWD
jgi:hypothetical protein